MLNICHTGLPVSCICLSCIEYTIHMGDNIIVYFHRNMLFMSIMLCCPSHYYHFCGGSKMSIGMEEAVMCMFIYLS